MPAAVRNDASERAVLLEEAQAQQMANMAAQASAQATMAGMGEMPPAGAPA